VESDAKIKIELKRNVSMKSKLNFHCLFNSVSTHMTTPTKRSATENTRNKIHAIKRL